MYDDVQGMEEPDQPLYDDAESAAAAGGGGGGGGDDDVSQSLCYPPPMHSYNWIVSGVGYYSSHNIVGIPIATLNTFV